MQIYIIVANVHYLYYLLSQLTSLRWMRVDGDADAEEAAASPQSRDDRTWFRMHRWQAKTIRCRNEPRLSLECTIFNGLCS